MKKKRKIIRDLDYYNSSQRFRPFGSSVLVVQFNDSLALQTESRLKNRFKGYGRSVRVHKTNR